MKHQVCASLLLVSFSLCADFDMEIIADKSKRVGRFSYEDSFDGNLVETVLKNSSAGVKRNVKRLLYPSTDEQDMQRLLLLGGTSNASTTAIAKAIATRCGYEYYVVEASALLQEYREGRQMLLSEIRPIIKQGKPIAIIITELPEMADYSGLLASTLWLLIDQCAQYPDVFVIGTSAFQKGQLSEEIKERFGSDIISVALDKSMQDSIENGVEPQPGWLEKNKVACFVAGGLVALTLAAAHLYAQMLFADAQAGRDNKQELLEAKMIALQEQALVLQRDARNRQDQMLLLNTEGRKVQNQALLLQKEGREVQDQMLLLNTEGCKVQNQALLLQKEGREVQDQMLLLDKEVCGVQSQALLLQQEERDMQGQQFKLQGEQYKKQVEQYILQGKQDTVETNRLKAKEESDKKKIAFTEKAVRDQAAQAERGLRTITYMANMLKWKFSYNDPVV